MTTTSWVMSGDRVFPGRLSSEKTIREPLRWSHTTVLYEEENISLFLAKLGKGEILGMVKIPQNKSSSKKGLGFDP